MTRLLKEVRDCSWLCWAHYLPRADQIGAVESVKAASDIYAPISGVVEAINEELDEQPALVNKSPEDEGASDISLLHGAFTERRTGWLCKIKLTNTSELEKLLDASAYKAHCEGEESQKKD